MRVGGKSRLLSFMSRMAGKKVAKKPLCQSTIVFTKTSFNMEEIRQNGKIILNGNDGISIKMIFKNLTGRNFQGQEYVEYIRHIAIGDMGFSPGIIEHCRDGEAVGKGTIPNGNPMKLQLHRDFRFIQLLHILYKRHPR